MFEAWQSRAAVVVGIHFEISHAPLQLIGDGIQLVGGQQVGESLRYVAVGIVGSHRRQGIERFVHTDPRTLLIHRPAYP